MSNLVRGTVSSWSQQDADFNYHSVLHRKDADATPQGLEHRIRREWASATSSQLCLRPDWNSSPLAYYELGPEWYESLRLGDLTEVEIKPETSKDDPHRLGVVKRIVRIWGSSYNSFPLDRPKWTEVIRRQQKRRGIPLFGGKLGRLLELTHALPGEGDFCTLYAPSNSGKSYLLRDFIKEARDRHPDLEVVVILSERVIDVLDYLNKVDSGMHLFIATADTPAIQRIYNAELGLQAAMRLAELGRRVLVVWDSMSKGFGDPLKSLPGPTGTGFEAGGVNILVRMLVPMLVNAFANTSVGSLTGVAVVLDENNPVSAALAEQCQNIGTAQLALCQDLAALGSWPALRYGIGRDKRKVSWSRRTGDWRDPDFVRRAATLNHRLSPEFLKLRLKQALSDEAKKGLTDGDYNPLVVREQARLQAQLRQLIAEGQSDEEIFSWFESHLDVTAAGSGKQAKQAASNVIAPHAIEAQASDDVVPSNGDGPDETDEADSRPPVWRIPSNVKPGVPAPLPEPVYPLPTYTKEQALAWLGGNGHPVA